MEPQTQPELARSLSLTTLGLYGIGTTLGAGIYVLTGVVAGKAIYLQEGLGLPLLHLAQLTSLVTLLVFALVRVSPWRVKRTGAPAPALSVPAWVPLAGAAVNVAFIAWQRGGWGAG